MRRFLFALVGAVLSAFYWWLVATFAFGLVGGDPGPAAPPRPESEQTLISSFVFIVAVLIYAAVTLVWQRLDRPQRVR